MEDGHGWQYQGIDYIFIGNIESMANQREPQVGDVYEGKYGLLFEIMPHPISIDKLILKGLKFESYHTIAELPDELIYKGKVTPRYKRLFGIYFVPDKDDKPST